MWKFSDMHQLDILNIGVMLILKLIMYYLKTVNPFLLLSYTNLGAMHSHKFKILQTPIQGPSEKCFWNVIWILADWKMFMLAIILLDYCYLINVRTHISCTVFASWSLSTYLPTYIPIYLSTYKRRCSFITLTLVNVHKK